MMSKYIFRSYNLVLDINKMMSKYIFFIEK